MLQRIPGLRPLVLLINSSIKMKMIRELWCINTDKETINLSPSLCPPQISHGLVPVEPGASCT